MIRFNKKISDPKGDNLNLIRLILAMAVVFSHAYAITQGRRNDEPLAQWAHGVTFGGIAVYSFFFISGFLITGSWQRSKSFIDYAIKRVLRIYPGYIAAMMFSAILIWVTCPEFKNGVIHDGNTGGWLLQVGRDALLLKSESISDISAWAKNPIPGLTNAPLWTIPIEFICYLAVLAAGLFGILRNRIFVLVLAVLGYEYLIMITRPATGTYDPLYICFLFGVLAWLWKDKIPYSSHIAIISMLALILTSHFRQCFVITFPLAGGYCLLWLAYVPQLPLAKWASTTDLSYGTYLYACPIQQLLATNAALRHPWMNFVLTIPVTFLLAWLSWTFLEKPCLSLKRRYAGPTPLSPVKA